jgi:hypothetical protein
VGGEGAADSLQGYPVGKQSSMVCMGVVRHVGFCREVWHGVPLLLGAFHFKQTWALNLKNRVSTEDMQQIIADLDSLSRFNESHPVLDAHQQAKAQIDAFFLKYKDTGTFAEYFKSKWAAW